MMITSNARRVTRNALHRAMGVWRWWVWLGVKAHLMPVPIPKLDDILIEINSQCNRKCRLCPNFDHTRKPGLLPEALFKKVISDLSEIGFDGNLSFNLYNEPLLDKRLPTLMKYVQQQLPRARMYLNTNGDFLDEQMWRILRNAGLQYASVTQYDGSVSEHIQRLFDSLPPEEKPCMYVHRLEDLPLNNRAGMVAVGSAAILPLRRYCDRPFRQLAINYIGKAVLCCNDYNGDVEIGDVREMSVSQLWRSPILGSYRKSLLIGDRKSLRLRNSCSA